REDVDAARDRGVVGDAAEAARGGDLPVEAGTDHAEPHSLLVGRVDGRCDARGAVLVLLEARSAVRGEGDRRHHLPRETEPRRVRRVIVVILVGDVAGLLSVTVTTQRCWG